MTLLLVGGSNDSQFSTVVQRLTERGVDFRVIDHNKPTLFDLRYSAQGEPVLLIGESRERVDPTRVWCRTKINTVFGNWDETVVHQFVSGTEWRSLLHGIAHLYEDRCVQDRAAVWRAELKPSQLAAATRVGLRIPDTAFFVGRDTAEDFLDSHESVVGKVIRAKNYPRTDGSGTYKRLLTFDVDHAAVDGAGDQELLRAPLFFQKRLRSGVEFRVIGFQHRAFAYEVIGGLETRDRPDDRMLFGHEYRMAELPDDIQRKLSRFLREMRLDYATFDMVRTADGEWYFLECNPEGQWSAANDLNLEDVVDEFIDALLLEQTAGPIANARSQPLEESLQ